MSRKVYYRYNPATGHYDRVYPSRGEMLWGKIQKVMLVLAAGGVIAVAFYLLATTPRERRLIDENRELRSQLHILSKRVDEALDVTSDIADRDNNFYRVLMGAQPVSASQRAGSAANEALYRRLNDMPDMELIKTLTRKTDLLTHRLAAQSSSFDELKLLAQDSRDRISHIPAIQPIAREHMKSMASGYGYRSDPIYGTSRFHAGLDFAADRGTPVYATADGKVTVAGRESDYGNVVDIAHGFGYLTRYAHLSKIHVKAGADVKRGDLIGEVGSTGKSTGNHLHYEVRLNDVPQNPIQYYFMDITPEEYAELVQQAENAGHVMD